MLLVLLVKIKKIVSALSGIMLNAKLVQQRSILMTQDERLDRIEAMLRFIIRELTYIPETDSMPEKPNLVRVK
jgi:hypothetical protein